MSYSCSIFAIPMLTERRPKSRPLRSRDGNYSRSPDHAPRSHLARGHAALHYQNVVICTPLNTINLRTLISNFPSSFRPKTNSPRCAMRLSAVPFPSPTIPAGAGGDCGCGCGLPDIAPCLVNSRSCRDSVRPNGVIRATRKLSTRARGRVFVICVTQSVGSGRRAGGRARPRTEARSPWVAGQGRVGSRGRGEARGRVASRRGGRSGAKMESRGSDERC